jgi:hypothetical protein
MVIKKGKMRLNIFRAIVIFDPLVVILCPNEPVLEPGCGGSVFAEKD